MLQLIITYFAMLLPTIYGAYSIDIPMKFEEVPTLVGMSLYKGVLAKYSEPKMKRSLFDLFKKNQSDELKQHFELLREVEKNLLNNANGINDNYTYDYEQIADALIFLYNTVYMPPKKEHKILAKLHKRKKADGEQAESPERQEFDENTSLIKVEIAKQSDREIQSKFRALEEQFTKNIDLVATMYHKYINIFQKSKGMQMFIAYKNMQAALFYTLLYKKLGATLQQQNDNNGGRASVLMAPVHPLSEWLFNMVRIMKDNYNSAQENFAKLFINLFEEKMGGPESRNMKGFKEKLEEFDKLVGADDSDQQQLIDLKKKGKQKIRS